MKETPDDPIFTTKGVILGALYCCVYAAIIFSTDPEWVGWAGPMAMGALYVPNQPPPLFVDPARAFEMGAKVSLLSLLLLVVFSVIREEEPFGLWALIKAWLKKPA